MNKGFLPYQDSFGNYFDESSNDFRQVSGIPRLGVPNVGTESDEPIVRTDDTEPNPLDVYSPKIRGFFMTSAGAKKSPTSIFYAYNGFARSSAKNDANCAINYGNLINIQQDIDSISSDPFNMRETLAEVQVRMGEFNAECEDQSQSQTTDDVIIEQSYDSPNLGGGLSGGGGGGSPLLGGDLSLYCSQVPDDPACQKSSLLSGSGTKMNWILIAGVAIAGFVAYKYFAKSKAE